MSFKISDIFCPISVTVVFREKATLRNFFSSALRGVYRIQGPRSKESEIKLTNI